MSGFRQGSPPPSQHVHLKGEPTHPPLKAKLVTRRNEPKLKRHCSELAETALPINIMHLEGKTDTPHPPIGAPQGKDDFETTPSSPCSHIFCPSSKRSLLPTSSLTCLIVEKLAVQSIQRSVGCVRDHHCGVVNVALGENVLLLPRLSQRCSRERMGV